MKNAVILHGLSNNSRGNWFPWLKEELEKKGYKVYVPNLPQTHHPNSNVSAEFVLKNWECNEESLLIGHSAGAVTIFAMLQKLPENVQVKQCILVSAFKNDLGRNDLSELFLEPFDFQKIKKKARKFIFVHSDNDPYIPLEQAEFLAKQVDGELLVKEGQGHFNLGESKAYKQFPFLLTLID